MASQVISAASVEALAGEAGFDLCGFARPEPIPSQVLGDWLAAGMCADMDWMRARAAERLDIQKLVPSARTVISLGCNYYHWDPKVESSPISRYARGRDYHATLRDRLRTLRRLLVGKWPELYAYNNVDTGPVMERVWAVRAGLGYVARNGCLITERYGSWVFLAVMVIDHEVDRYNDKVVADACGSCTLCVTSCPTDAIVADRTVDARLCLSYQTIENEGEVPAPLRPAFMNLVFGCDICQAVCPLNASPIVADSHRFAPRAVASLGVRELADLSREQYDALTPGTPLARTGYDGLRRNAAYALGAMKDEGARETLARLSGDPSDVVRAAANWALEQLGTRRYVSAP